MTSRVSIVDFEPVNASWEVSICPKSPTKKKINVVNVSKVNSKDINDGNDVILVSLMKTLNAYSLSI